MTNISAIYPGTFDPVTNGHLDMIKRGASLFKTLVVGVAASEGKKPFFDLETRINLIQTAIPELKNVKVVGFHSLLIDFAKQHDAKVILRGLRAVGDFEYEFQLAGMNRNLDSEIETLFLTPDASHMFISSSLVREIAVLRGDISSFVPANVISAFNARLG